MTIDDIQIVLDWNTGSELKTDDLLAREFLNVHDQRSKRVTVCSDQDVFASGELRKDGLLPVREDSLSGEFKGLCVVSWWRNVVRASPNENLLIAPLLSCVVLVEALELAVVALVKCLVLGDWEVRLANLVLDDGERLLSALKSRGVGVIEFGVRGLETLSTELSLLLSFLRELDIDPAGDEVLLVPFRFSVAGEYECLYECSVGALHRHSTHCWHIDPGGL